MTSRYLYCSLLHEDPSGLVRRGPTKGEDLQRTNEEEEVAKRGEVERQEARGSGRVRGEIPSILTFRSCFFACMESMLPELFSLVEEALNSDDR